jgi:Lrp/AsnC family transcriptional regulator, leucine-responsive regulatory protein
MKFIRSNFTCAIRHPVYHLNHRILFGTIPIMNPPSSVPTVLLDATDRAILLELQRDSRQTYAEIGSCVSLAAASVHDRVKKLEKRGLVIGYGAKVSPDALGLSTLAFIQIRLENHSNCMAVAPNFIQFPEVEECHSVAGDVDVILKVRSQNPHTLEQLLYRIKQVPGVVRTTTLVTLSTAFENQPIQALQPDITP